ncbi:MAG: glycosyltransferase family 39 protein [Acidobacteriaceae bacterium]|nr:glycosyltransferase family 39 protein [Acidobacteriaceae bacterium]MBV9296091.1 glycosyltransferase family 39 protein [Acidobacteriaceae bacterium]MBV9767534.1 glycosyltransferase family 39 protein [Acidobacteriaceae bacterium]
MATARPALSPPEQRPLDFVTRLAAIRDRLESARFTRVHSRLLLAAVILFYLAITALSVSRQLWHDELFTYYIAKSPSLARFWQAVHLDLNPPLSYLLVRGSIALIGDSIYATRFPSIIGFLVGSLCFYRFVSKRLGPAFALLAMLVFWATPFFSFSTEARPYGLIVGFFGIAMLAWDAATETRRSGFAIPMLAFAVTGMMLSHFLTVFYILPFCLAELFRWYLSRRFDLPLWAALLVPLIIPFAYLSTMKRYQAALFPPSFQASLGKVTGFFYRTLDPESLILLLALCLAMVVAFRRERRVGGSAISSKPLDAVFSVGLLSLPLLINVVVMRSHGVAFHRYSGPTVFAYGLLFAFFLAVYTNANRLAALVASFLLLVYIAGVNLVPPALTVWHTWRTPTRDSLPPPFIQGVRPDLPLVAASGLTFLEMDRYADPVTVSRLYYLCDRELAIHYAHATIFEGFPVLKQYFPIRANVEPYQEFVRQHPSFLVLGTPDYPEDWLLRRLMDIHAIVRYLGDFPGPYKDSQLYAVSMPGS